MSYMWWKFLVKGSKGLGAHPLIQVLRSINVWIWMIFLHMNQKLFIVQMHLNGKYFKWNNSELGLNLK
jgi:hypothetical protein